MERVLLVFLTWYTLTSNIGLKGSGFFPIILSGLDYFRDNGSTAA